MQQCTKKQQKMHMQLAKNIKKCMQYAKDEYFTIPYVHVCDCVVFYKFKMGSS